MEQNFPFQSSPLPYSYVGLMPYCDADTLYYHHDGYYDSAVYELNNLVVRHRLTSPQPSSTACAMPPARSTTTSFTSTASPARQGRPRSTA